MTGERRAWVGAVFALALPGCSLALDFGPDVLLPALDGGGRDAPVGVDASPDVPADLPPIDGGCVGACPCPVGRGDCDGLAANGCETDLTATDSHCGACGVACPGSQQCTDGLCRGGGCRAPAVACGTQCADLLTDPRHCGACGASCSAGAPRCCRGTCAVRCP